MITPLIQRLPIMPLQTVNPTTVAFTVVFIVVLTLVLWSLKPVARWETRVITSDGEVTRIRDGRLAFVVPFIEQSDAVVDVPQECECSVSTPLEDGKTISADARVQFEVTDPEVAVEWTDNESGVHHNLVRNEAEPILIDALKAVGRTSHGARTELTERVKSDLQASITDRGLRVETVEFDDLTWES